MKLKWFVCDGLMKDLLQNERIVYGRINAIPDLYPKSLELYGSGKMFDY